GRRIGKSWRDAGDGGRGRLPIGRDFVGIARIVGTVDHGIGSVARIAAGKEEQEPQDREVPPKHRRVPPRGCGARSTPGRFTAAAGPPAAHETKTFPFGWKGISREGSGFLRVVWAGTAHARPPRRPMPENRSSAGRGPGSLAGGHAL